MTGKNALKGIVAGFVATVVLSALMVVKSKMGIMPELDIIAMLSKMMGVSTLAIGWVAHFMIGAVVWGTVFVWLSPSLPGGSFWLKGVSLGVGAWLLMMIVIMPMAGAGLFGLHFGVMAPLMTFVLHAVFGAVLGAVYAAERSGPSLSLFGVD